jgi:hypothetical protein
MSVATRRDRRTVAERMDAGRALRDAVPRGSHAGLSLATSRPDPIDVPLCGDAHLANFGLFATPERHIIFELNDSDETARPAGLTLYGAFCGATLTRAHARSGDAAIIAGYIGTGTSFRKAIVAFAEAYADKTERDHARLVGAIDDGLIPAQAGV